jgi:hypothetical protein
MDRICSTSVGYVLFASDMFDLDSFKPKIVVTFGSNCTERSNEVDMFYDTLEGILPKE